MISNNAQQLDSSSAKSAGAYSSSIIIGHGRANEMAGGGASHTVASLDDAASSESQSIQDHHSVIMQSKSQKAVSGHRRFSSAMADPSTNAIYHRKMGSSSGQSAYATTTNRKQNNNAANKITTTINNNNINNAETSSLRPGTIFSSRSAKNPPTSGSNTFRSNSKAHASLMTYMESNPFAGKTAFSPYSETSTIRNFHQNKHLTKRVPNIVLLTNFQSASSKVQNTLLQIISKKAVIEPETEINHSFPRPFMIIALTETGFESNIDKHLMDRFFISHFITNSPKVKDIEAVNNSSIGGSASLTSLYSKDPLSSCFKSFELEDMHRCLGSIHLEMTMQRYQRGIVSCLRQYQPVSPHLSCMFSFDYELAAKCLAILQGRHYVTYEILMTVLCRTLQHRCKNMRLHVSNSKDLIQMIEFLSLNLNVTSLT